MLDPNDETQPSSEPSQTIDPGLKTALDKLLVTIQNKPAPPESNGSDEFKNEILKKAKPTEEQLLMAFIPHQMAKTSIFFPMSRQELKEKNRRITRIEQKSSWGRIVVEGVKLSLFEEELLMVITHIIKKSPNRMKMITGLPTLDCTLNELVSILYGRKGYTKASYQRILRGLDHFQMVRFELAFGDWKKKGKEQLKIEQRVSIGSIFSRYKHHEDTNNLSIGFNPAFIQYFSESMLTYIDLNLRRRLKKDGSKAILRFLRAHTNPDPMHINTILDAINFNTNQPAHLLRWNMKQFIAELKKHNVLGPKTRLKNDIVSFHVLPFSHSLPDA